MQHGKYLYHVEDGQFSFDDERNELLGLEGDVIKLTVFEKDDHNAYILFIEGNYVECLGDIERSFPKTPHEHEEMKQWVKELYAKQ